MGDAAKILEFVRFHREKTRLQEARRAEMTEEALAGAEAWLDGLAPERAGSTEGFELDPPR